MREAFVRSRRALRGRVADGRPWEAQELAVVLVALAHGLALEGLPDPTAVPDGLVDRVLRTLVL